MGYNLIPSSANVDNVTIDKNANDEIEIKGGAVDRTLLNTDLQKKTDGWVELGTLTTSASIQTFTIPTGVSEIRIDTETAGVLDWIFGRINNISSNNYNYGEFNYTNGVWSTQILSYFTISTYGYGSCFICAGHVATFRNVSYNNSMVKIVEGLLNSPINRNITSIQLWAQGGHAKTCRIFGRYSQ